MELSFVIDAVRRYYWVIVLCAVLGAFPGIAAAQNAQPSYQARSALLIIPARESQVQITFAGDNERYVASQIASMSSSRLAEEVAERLDNGLDGRAIEAATTIAHVPSTDIVEVVAESGDPATAQEIANEFAQTYIDGLNDQIDDSRSPEVERMGEQLEQLRERLRQVDDQIAAEMARFLDPANVPASGEAPPIPGLEQVVPGLVSEKTILLSQYDQILTAQTELGLNPSLTVASEIVQPASLPLVPMLPQTKLLVAAGIIGGTFLGVLAAVVLARLSPRLLSIRHAEEIVGLPIANSVPHARMSNGRDLITSLPGQLVPAFDSIAVRAEASPRTSDTLVLVVAGVARGAGSTTLAMAMANRFLAQEMTVLLVDADVRHPQITETLTRVAVDRLRATPLAADEFGELHELGLKVRPGNVPGLSVLGVGERGSSFAVRRKSADELVRATSKIADVVIFDTGPLMKSSLSLQLTQLADVVVLAISHHANAAMLAAVVHQLESRRGDLLPVWMPTRRRSQGRGRSKSAAPDPNRDAVPTTLSPLDDGIGIGSIQSGYDTEPSDSAPDSVTGQESVADLPSR